MTNIVASFFMLLSLGVVATGQSSAQTSSWSTPIALNDKTFYVDYPAMSLGRRGEIYVVWECKNQPPDDLKAQLFLARFDGQRWLPPVAITDTGRMDWTPDIATDTLGNPHVVWGEYGSGEIYYRWFDGARWSEPQNVSQNSGASFYPRIAIDHKNRVHVVWHDNTVSDWNILYKMFDGANWSPTVNLSDTLLYATFPRICIDAWDDLHVTFHCRTYPIVNEDVFYMMCQQGTWTTLSRITADTLHSLYPDIAVFNNGLPFIVWSQVLLPWPLRRVLFSRSDWGEWTSPLPVADTSESDTPSIAIDNEDNVHVVWELYDRLHSLSRIMHTSLSNEKWTPPQDITGAIGGSGRPILKVDVMNTPHVVWVCEDNGIYYTHLNPAVNVIREEPHLPNDLVLLQNYPNPFNSSTFITFSLAKEGFITLKVLDVLGREAKTLVAGKQAQGAHSITFDASDCSTGVYFFQLRSQAQTITKKMVLIR